MSPSSSERVRLAASSAIAPGQNASFGFQATDSGSNASPTRFLVTTPFP
jgi:hypothetical protein